MPWKQIRNFPDYLISSYGVVRKKEGGFVRWFTRDGYNYVCMTDGHGVNMEVRQDIIIAKNLIPNPKRRLYVEHIDGDTLNDNVTNLRWSFTKSEKLINL